MRIYKAVQTENGWYGIQQINRNGSAPIWVFGLSYKRKKAAEAVACQMSGFDPREPKAYRKEIRLAEKIF